MQRLCKWIFLLNKRLYKKASFIVILVLIIAAMAGFGVLFEAESGFLNIVLVNKNKNDAISTGIVKDLLSEKSMILFKEVSTAKEAVDKVKAGSADAAWIFSENTQKDIKEFLDNNSKVSMVSVVEREQNVALRLSHEKLTAKLYRYASKQYYISFVRDKIWGLDKLSDDEIGEYFDNTNISDELFVYGDVKGSTEMTDINYLTAPIKGLLAVIITVCGMAGMLYYMQDKKRKTFDLIPEDRRFYLAYISVFIAVLNVAVVCFAALIVTGTTVAILKEIICILLFALSVSSFCVLLYSIFPKINLFASLIPVLTVALICICPVFYDFTELRALSHIFPVTYYLRAAYDNTYIMLTVLYTAVCFILARIITKINKTV